MFLRESIAANSREGKLLFRLGQYTFTDGEVSCRKRLPVLQNSSGIIIGNKLSCGWRTSTTFGAYCHFLESLNSLHQRVKTMRILEVSGLGQQDCKYGN